MCGIKLKVFKRSGRCNDLNEAYSSLSFTPPLNGIISACIAIFGIKSKVMMTALRKCSFIVFLKWVILNLDIEMVLPFKCI